jgi:serine/threonine-protein kinase
LRVVTLLDRGVREASSLDTDPPVQAELYQTLGTIYGGLGKFERADALLQRALEKRESLFGRESREVVESLVALGLLRSDEAQETEAEELVRRGLAVGRRILSPDHPVVAKAMSALGRVLINRGAYALAIPVLDEAARLLSRRGDSPVDLGMTITDLANAQFYLGHYAESEALNLRGLAMDRQNFGALHANVADDLINLGAIAHERGQYAEAERLHREALEITERWFGKDHFKTASNLTLLARALDHQGRDDEAGEMLERALAINERVYGRVHPSVASSLADLGHVARHRGKLDEAEAHYQRMLDIERAVHKDKHELIGVALANLASVHSERGQYLRAEDLLREALAIYAQTLPADHLRTGVARITLGHALVKQGRYAEAETESLAGYSILTNKTNGAVSWLKQAREDLAETYDALQQPEKSAKFRAVLAGSETTPVAGAK